MEALQRCNALCVIAIHIINTTRECHLSFDVGEGVLARFPLLSWSVVLDHPGRLDLMYAPVQVNAL